MSRIINFEGRKITVPDDATDDEVSQIIGGPSAPGPKPETSQTLGFEQGVGNFIANAAKPGIWAGKKLGLDMSQFEQGGELLRNPQHDPNVVPGKVGRFGADVLETIPLAATLPATLPAAIAGGGIAGGLTADPGHQAAGALLGAGTGGLFNAAGRVIAPHASDAVTRLRNAGVTLTPGQIFGGITKGVEDRMAGLPLLDYFVRGAQRGALRDANTAAGNMALSPLNAGNPVLAPGVVGHDMSTAAEDAFDNAYGQVLPQINVNLGQPLSSAVTDAGDRVAARLPDEYSGQFNGTLADVFKKMNAGQTQPTNSFPGQAVKDAYSDLGYEARAYRSPTASPNDRALGGAYQTVQQGLRDSFQASDPWAAPVLERIDQAYGNFIPVDKAIRSASGNGGGLEPGVFTGKQLRSAILSNDRSVRGVAGSRGTLPLQQHAEDMIQVLPSSVADSGTAGRAALPAMAAEAILNPAATAKALALGMSVPALYSRPGLALTNAMFARQAGPGATALGGLMQRLGAPAAGGVGGTTGGKR